jgi:CRP/FNR family transcriptional regulator
MTCQSIQGPPDRTTSLHSHQPKAGSQCQGLLWSTLEEICRLLCIESVSLASDRMLFQHVQFRTGQRILRYGDSFDTLYIVNSGFLKTMLIDDFGNEKVLGFPMKGDMLGMDGIHIGHHTSETLALSECDLILLPFTRLNSLSRTTPDIEQLMYRMMSRELALRQAMIGMLGTLSAEARVARFLVALSDRFAEMGYSSKTFNLRMKRQEIGSYLGLTTETVSRTISAFHETGCITVQQRTITIVDAEALKALRRLPSSHAHQALRRSSTGLPPNPSASR